MEKFQDVVIDPSGNALAGVMVTVKDFGTTNNSTIYADNAKTPLPNPITTDANGHFFFYAEQGRYSLDLSGGGVTPKSITDLWVDDVIYARKESPVFTGTPTAPTPPQTDNSQKLATTAFAAGLLSAHVGATDPHPVYMTKAEVDARSGGKVTQLTDKTTAVTLDKNTGEITTAAGVIGAGTGVAFKLNSLTIGADDNIIVNLKSGSGVVGVYQVWAEEIVAGSCNIVIQNIGRSAYNEILKLQYTVFKGAIA